LTASAPSGLPGRVSLGVSFLGWKGRAKNLSRLPGKLGNGLDKFLFSYYFKVVFERVTELQRDCKEYQFPQPSKRLPESN
jgi:hypothetical protein